MSMPVSDTSSMVTLQHSPKTLPLLGREEMMVWISQRIHHIYPTKTDLTGSGEPPRGSLLIGYVLRELMLTSLLPSEGYARSGERRPCSSCVLGD